MGHPHPMWETSDWPSIFSFSLIERLRHKLDNWGRNVRNLDKGYACSFGQLVKVKRIFNARRHNGHLLNEAALSLPWAEDFVWRFMYLLFFCVAGFKNGQRGRYIRRVKSGARSRKRYLWSQLGDASWAKLVRKLTTEGQPDRWRVEMSAMQKEARITILAENSRLDDVE